MMSRCLLVGNKGKEHLGNCGRGLIIYDFRIHPHIQIVFPVTYSATETISSALNSDVKLSLSALCDVSRCTLPILYGRPGLARISESSEVWEYKGEVPGTVLSVTPGTEFLLSNDSFQFIDIFYIVGICPYICVCIYIHVHEYMCVSHIHIYIYMKYIHTCHVHICTYIYNTCIWYLLLNLKISVSLNILLGWRRVGHDGSQAMNFCVPSWTLFLNVVWEYRHWMVMPTSHWS